MIPTDLEITLEFLDSPTEVDFFAVAGAPGHDGQDGADGAPGRDGADGHTPVITASKQGTVTTISVDGDPIAQILDGATGAKGDKGDPGQDGAKGDKGDTGAKGDKGDKGDTGAQGIQGIQGEKGDTGAKGDKGDKGDTGATGAAGQDGHTPVKGTDYWTAADKAEIVEEAAEEIDLSNYVQKTDYASSSEAGVVKVNSAYGAYLHSTSKQLIINRGSSADIKSGVEQYKPIVPYTQHESAFYAIAKAAGDSTQSASSNTVGNYTDAAKVAIQKMLGIYEPPWELLNDITLTERGQIDLTADSNGTPYNLLSVYMELVVPANSTAEPSGYGRYHFYDLSGDYLTAESGRYQGSTANQYKNIYVQRDSDMVRVPYTRYTSTGSNSTWVMKSLESRGGKIGFGNIVRIAINASDYEPAGTKIKIYAQRAY